jgi:glycosyltransferase involved in cell wall biosynthesis
LGVAPGTTEREVAALIARHHLKDRVHLAGEVPLERVFHYYDQADAFALPSYTEGFPNTLLEAMMSGLAAVVTPVGAIPEVITQGEGGLFVPVGEVEPLANALQQLAADRELTCAMGRVNRENAEKSFSRGAVVQKMVNLYKDLLS